MTVSITPLYAALLTLFFVLLSARVITYRRANKVSLGSGGDAVLERRIRAQGNCAEYAPLGLVLMLGAELAGAGPVWLQSTGLLLLAGRFLHGTAFSFLDPNMPMRVGGMVLTLTSLVVSALACLVASF